MPKYYVQSGPVEEVVVADSLSHAAMAAVDRRFQRHRWIYEDGDLSDLDRQDHLMLEALCHLDPSLQISERGFDREDAHLIGTPETVARWHRLMTEMHRLAFAARKSNSDLFAVAGRGHCPPTQRRLPR